MDTERWRQIDSILQLALDREAAERKEFLDIACAEDRGLKAEVERLLALEGESADLLPGLESLSAETFPVREGDVIGAWSLGPRIGEGGSGIVFAAERSDGSYERQVAFKCLRYPLFSRVSAERFLTECRVLARLEHPNIARLWETGTTDEGLPFLVMEKVDGLPIDEWCRLNEPSLDERLALFEQVCDAVAVAHRNLIIHRDLKPSNILVAEDGKPKLLDFGIARVLASDVTEASRLTRTGFQPMTPQYASPEQMRGDDVTTAADVYSLGLILYQLLTGKLPYEVPVGGLPSLDALIVNRERLRPSAVQDTQVPTQSLRGDLDLIVQTALSPDLGDRYDSAAQLGEEIRRFRVGLPISARAPGALYLARKFVRRHRVVVGAALLTVGLLVAFAVNLALSAKRLESERNRANAEAATAREVVGLLEGLFEGAEPAFHQGRDITAREMLDRGADSLRADEAVRAPATRAAMSSVIGKAYLELSALDASREFLESALSIRQSREGVDPALLAESYELLAKLERVDSHFEAAEQHASSAVTIRRTLTEPVPLAQALLLQGEARIGASRLDEAEAAMLEGLEILAGTAQEHPLITGLLSRGLCEIEAARGAYDDLSSCDRALELLSLVHGEQHPEVFVVRRLVAARDRSYPNEELERLLEDQRRLFGENHAQIVLTLQELGRVEQEVARDLDRSLDYYLESRRMQEQLFGPHHLQLAHTNAGLGHIYSQQGRREEAVQAYREGLRVARKNLAPGSIDLAWPLTFLAEELAFLGRYDEAATLYGEAYENLSHHLDPDDGFRVDTALRLGIVMNAARSTPEGVDLLLGALEIAQTPGFSPEPIYPSMFELKIKQAWALLATLHDCLAFDAEEFMALYSKAKVEGISVLPPLSVLRTRLDGLVPCAPDENGEPAL